MRIDQLRNFSLPLVEKVLPLQSVGVSLIGLHNKTTWGLNILSLDIVSLPRDAPHLIENSTSRLSQYGVS